MRPEIQRENIFLCLSSFLILALVLKKIKLISWSNIATSMVTAIRIASWRFNNFPFPLIISKVPLSATFLLIWPNPRVTTEWCSREFITTSFSLVPGNLKFWIEYVKQRGVEVWFLQHLCELVSCLCRLVLIC